MEKDNIIQICESMKFKFDFDTWDDSEKGYMRFCLNRQLDEKDLRLIVYKTDTIEEICRRAGDILFKAGQKAFKLRLESYSDLNF